MRLETAFALHMARIQGTLPAEQDINRRRFKTAEPALSIRPNPDDEYITHVEVGGDRIQRGYRMLKLLYA